MLLQAARDGDYEAAKRSLKSSVFRRSEDVNVRDDRECSALHYAVKISHSRLVRLLLDKGADIQAEDKHGWSVLHYAVRYGDLETTQLLIERGADIHCQERRGWTVSYLITHPPLPPQISLSISGPPPGRQERSGREGPAAAGEWRLCPPEPDQRLELSPPGGEVRPARHHLHPPGVRH